MKKRLFLRAVCFLLALLMLTGLASCAKTPQPSAPTGQRLEVERDDVQYGADFVQESAARIAQLTARFLFLSNGMQLSDANLQIIRERASSELLPACMRARLYPEELSAILSLAEEYCDSLESNDLAPAARFAALCSFYARSVTAVGSERAGRLLYESTSLYLNAQTALCEQRYRDYGYAWYLEDAERYRAKVEMLQESIGAENFSHAVQVLLFVGSLAAGIAPNSAELSLLYDAELLLILRRQSGHFATLTLTGEQWAFMAELLSDAVPDKRDRVWSAELAVLFSQGRVDKMAATLPRLLTLYDAFTNALDEQDLAMMREGEATLAVCRVLAQCKQPLAELLQEFYSAASGASAQELAALSALGQRDAIEQFIVEHPAVTTDELIGAIESIALGITAPEELEGLLCGWLCGAAPYMTFAISTSVRSVG